MAIELHHVNISTPDLKRMWKFYEDAFGFERVFEHNLEDYDITEMITGVKGAVASTVTLRGANCFIELFQWSAPKGKPLEPLRPFDYGYTHICWAVDDADVEFKRLSDLGVPFVYGKPTSSEFDGGKYASIYGRDPDGNVIELIQTPRGVSLSLDTCPSITKA
jgi:catechol 2,3-dioxygenase-like lactoylglutathione lyase family enzyme